MAQQWRACAALLGTRVQFAASKLSSSQLPVTSVTEGSDISGLKSTCTHMHIPAHRHIHKNLKRRYVHQDVWYPAKLLSRVWIKLLSPSLSSSFKTSIGKKAYLQFSVSLSLFSLSSHHAGQTDLKLTVLLSQHPEFWHYRHWSTIACHYLFTFG